MNKNQHGTPEHAYILGTMLYKFHPTGTDITYLLNKHRHGGFFLFCFFKYMHRAQ